MALIAGLIIFLAAALFSSFDGYPSKSSLPSSEIALINFSPRPTIESTTVLPPTEISDLDALNNSIPMLLAPEGEFTMGSNDGDTDEKPVHRIFLHAFYIDKYEVTNSLYKACVDAGVCEPPHDFRSKTHSDYYENAEFDDYPVIFVDWFQAKIYCEWRGAALPTEAQWEKAARGADGRTYPWGEGISCDKASYGSCRSDLDRVGRYEGGKSPYGVYDMAGNVWEWVADWYSETYSQNSSTPNPSGPDQGEYRVLRGGTWDSNANNLRTSSRLKYRPAYFTEGIGFRCAKDANP
jgi:formylglycine-generating enzyme required for sulfatase activity